MTGFTIKEKKGPLSAILRGDSGSDPSMRVLVVPPGTVLSPEDGEALGRMLEEAGNGDLIVNLCRISPGQTSVPGESAFLRHFSRLLLYLETEVRLTDPHTPCRCWPASAVAGLAPLGGSYEDLALLSRAAAGGIPVRELQLTGPSVIPPVKRTGFWTLNALHFLLVILSLFWYRPKRWLGRFRHKNLRSGMALLLEMRDSPLKKALSLSFGLFMGILPIYGFQVMLALPAALFLKLNKPLVLLGIQISAPPFIPLLVFTGIKIGGCLLREPFPGLDLKAVTLETATFAARQFYLGSVVLAAIVALAAGLLSFLLFSLAGIIKRGIPDSGTD
jgi:uncharacterized protein (DUF2062 family)